MTGRQALHAAIRSTADPMALMDRIVVEALKLVPSADGASLEMRRDVDTLEYVSAAGTLAPFVGLRLPLHQSMSGLAVRTGVLQVSDDALHDDRVNAQAVATTGIRSMLCVPLSADSAGVAVLKVSASTPHAFTPRDASSLRKLAQFLVTAVEAASRLATVTAELLSELETRHSDGDVPMSDDDEARFVANVMTPGLADRTEMAAEVRDVLERDAIEIVLQPIVAMDSGRMVACEALARIQGVATHPPHWWFHAAHTIGLGVQVEKRAVLKSLALLSGLPQHIRMSINVGVDLLLDAHFLDLFDGHRMQRLTVELTEHVPVTDYAAVIEVKERLRARGARLSIDDTGSGYSGLTHILRLTPDVIKLDRELVTNLDADPAKFALVSALVTFARSIDAEVVAEGIERPAEADHLRRLGVEFGQGYLFHRPMSLRKVGRLVEQESGASVV